MSATTDLILRLRQLGLSQSEISRRTGIPQPRLSRWENGEAPDSADDALKLHDLHALLGSPEQLAGAGHGAMVPATSPAPLSTLNAPAQA